jgi:hypothetical protein
VDVSREALAARFQQLSDDELLSRVANRALTPLALEVAGAELQARGLDASSEGETVDAIEICLEGEDATEVDLVTVAEFWNPMEANLLRGLLESKDVFVHLWGEHLGVAHTFLSVASGGMKLQVPVSQVAMAREIIAAFHRGELAMEDDGERG